MTGSIAEQRVYEAVRLMRAPVLTCGIRFEIVEGHGSASWSKRPGDKKSTIQIDRELAERLSINCLSALILHELSHACGINFRLIDPTDKHPVLVNLALDIILERTLSERQHLRHSLRELNNEILGDLASRKKLTLSESTIYLVHSRPPMELMPRGFKTRWNQVWRGRIRFLPEDVYALLASIKKFDLSSLPPRYRRRYTPGQRNVPELTFESSQSWEQDRLKSDSNELSTVESALAPAVWQLSDVKEFIKNEIHFSSANNILIEERSSRQFGHETQWLKSKLRFDPANAIRQLVHSGNQTKIVSSPFLINPTPGAIANYLSPTPQLYYDNFESSTPSLSAVYIDVSYSMKQSYPDIVSFAKTLKLFRPANVFIFSRKVEPISLNQLCTGRFFTSGGTSIDSVLKHVLLRKPKQFFIVTDNEDVVCPSLLRNLKTAGIQSLALVFGDDRRIPWDQSYYVSN